MSDLDDDLPTAIAILARGLQGALEHARSGGVEHLPRPAFVLPAGASTAGVSPTAARPAAVSAASAPVRETAQAPAPDRPAPPPVSAAPPSVSAAPPSSSRAAAPPRLVSPEPPPRSTAPPAARAALPIVGDAAAAIAALLASDAPNAERLERLRTEVIGECTRCKLHRGRSRLVFGVGNPNAALVFVGEGPGADEDRQGVPFVGKAGQLLTKMIGAMGFGRDDVYICNVVKCRPPSNRDPEPDEVETCEPFLQAQLAILRPLVIVALGRHAAQTLLRCKTPITRLRGTWQEYRGVPLMPTYHPSYLLREEVDPEKKRKREAWSDLQAVMKVFGKDRAN